MGPYHGLPFTRAYACPYSYRTGRNHELLSDGENETFAMLEWRLDNADIREQFPLDRDISWK